MKNGETKASANPLDESVIASSADLQKIYKDEDKEYLSFIQIRLQNARDIRNNPMPEFSGKTYLQYYTENEKIANTYHLDPKKNPDDVVVSAGTIEQKLDSLLSHINNLNLSPEVMAFNKENDKVVSLGVAIGDIIHDTEVQDGGDGAGDEEKKLLRQRELLKQGTVFVQEEWTKKWKMEKKLKQKWNGEFKDFAGYTEELYKCFEGPSRTLLYGPNVYLGDITKFYMEEQPFIFVLIRTNYADAKSKYGKFENWKYVKPGMPKFSESDTTGSNIFDNKWRLTELEKDQVEIILYQDRFRNEFQIIINGVMMIPIGFPLSAVCPRGEYNVSKQVYRVLSDKFSYGGSFVSSGSIKEISAIIDEMLKLFVLKTRKSFTASYINTSGRVIDKKVLSPGRISMGINPGDLVRVDPNDGQGVTAGEAAVLEKMQTLIDKSTVSDQFTGQAGPGNQTATEILEIQRQARLTLGLTVAACMLLEKKLGYLRLYNILENWFEPIDERVEGIEAARKMVSVYRSSTRDGAQIPGEGPGLRSVILKDDELPVPEAIRDEENADEKSKGVPVRKIYINPKELRKAGLIWYIVIDTKERESSPFFKALFREMLGDMQALMSLGSIPNKEGLEEEFARVWGKPRNKLFASTNMNPAMAGVSPAMQGQNGAARAPNTPGTPMKPGGLAGAAM